MQTLLIVFVASAVFLVLAWYDLPHIFCDDYMELALRTSCASNQKHIWLALEEYHRTYGKLPDNLEALVTTGQINEKQLYCPTPFHYLGDKIFYEYYPTSFGEASKIVLTEDAGNHAIKGWKRRRLPPVVFQTMSDATLMRHCLTDPNYDQAYTLER